MGQAVIVRHDEDGISRVSVATVDSIEEWEVGLDGVRLLVDSVSLAA